MLQRIYRLVEFLFKTFVHCHKKFGIFWPPLTDEEKLKREGTALPKKPVKGGVILREFYYFYNNFNVNLVVYKFRKICQF